MTTFTAWAPSAESVELVLGVPSGGPTGPVAMSRTADGWWSVTDEDAGHGSRYAFRVDGGDPTPDPRSRWQPDGVHAPSAVYDHTRFAWTDGDWAGTDPAATVAYELHVGTFTDVGTLDGAVDRLPHLVDLGITLVELLPVAAFDGTAGWGYDGVGLHAVHEPYGGPDALKRFVDAAHGLGMGVCVDAVYNHFGPSGNYVARFGPYFTDRYSTPWGDAVNLDDAESDTVRAFVLDSAAQWLRDFHVDALRLDATHAYYDPERAVSLQEDLAAMADGLTASTGVRRWLVAENELNDPDLTAPRTGTGTGTGGIGLHAQWADDIHHSLHALLTGESSGYYADFAADPYASVRKVATRVFFHDGTFSTFRRRTHGRPVDPATTHGSRFWAYLQDHDQVGNRATGDRITASTPLGLVLIGATLVLTSPFVPMLFMGEEWAASTPWCYFTSHPEPALATAVRDGRRGEFASHGWAPGDVPDPQAAETCTASVLDWAEPEQPEHAAVLAFYRRLIALRRAVPELTDGRLDACSASYDEAARWFVLRRGPGVAVVCNLGEQRQEVPVGGTPMGVLLATEGGFGFRDGLVELAPQTAAVVRLLVPLGSDPA